MYQILTWNLMYCRSTREKFWSSKVGKKIVCRYSLPSVRVWHSANLDGRRWPLPDATFCRAPGFAEGLTLGKKGLCRVSGFTECLTLGKFFVECISLPSATLSKIALCRVPDFQPSAKKVALGKGSVSHSASPRPTPTSFPIWHRPHQPLPYVFQFFGPHSQMQTNIQQ